MKKIIALFLVSVVTLAACTNYQNPGISDSYYQCQIILRKLYEAPHRYRITGRNKLLPTEKAKLHREYRHYRCDQYEHVGNLK